MPTNFNIAHIPEIVFGSGQVRSLPSHILNYGQEIVFLTGKSSFISSPFWDSLREDFVDHKISYGHFSITGEPTVKMIDDITTEIGDIHVDVVVAIGGGSVLDAGKAVAAMIGKNASVKTFLEGVGTKNPDGSTLPFIAVPTTSGTGSECTKNAVISEVGDSGYKKSLRHDNFIPKMAIVDPELILDCPLPVSAMVGIDAFTQLLESYVSTKANHFTDALSLTGLEKISLYFEKVMKEPSNLIARAGMAYASMLGGITLANAGLGTVHGFASSVGGRFEIPHGVICSKMMAPCNIKTIKSLGFRDLPEDQFFLTKYANVGKLFTSKNGKDNDYYIDVLLDTITRYNEEYCDFSFYDYGFDQSAIASIVEGTGNKNNPIELLPEQLTDILKSIG